MWHMFAPSGLALEEDQMPEPNEADNEDLQRLVDHLKEQEITAEDATLSNMESLQAWIMAHPGLQQPGIYEMINQYGPALLQVLRRMVGL
jgi:hypothetical protein